VRFIGLRFSSLKLYLQLTTTRLLRSQHGGFYTPAALLTLEEFFGHTFQDNMESSSLTKLCTFGAEVGSRLVRLAAWVDGMPSAVKSLGFEIWATCEIL
jgi:hypothetical protein